MDNELRKGLRLLMVACMALSFLDLLMGFFGATLKILTGVVVVAAMAVCIKRVSAAWYIALAAVLADIVLTFLLVPFPWGIALLVVAFLAIYMLFKPDVKEYVRGKKKAEAPTVEDGRYRFSCDYFSGGGMEGGKTVLSLVSMGPGKAFLDYEITRYNGDETKSGRISAPDKAVSELKGMFYGYGIKRWKLEKSDLIALDAPSVDVCFTVGNDVYRISDDDVLPEKGSDVISRTYDVLMGIYLKNEADSDKGI